MTDSASRFHALHAVGQLLVLPNAWDAVSARIVESAGAKAIATSSAALAWAHGYPDGQQLPRQTLFEVTREIVRVVQVPVSVDFEAGFDPDPTEATLTLLDTGVVGINLEDGVDAPSVHARRIQQVRAAADHAGVKLFINARCDVYLRPLVAPERALEEILARGKLYRDAGADGLFAAGLVEQRAVETLAREITLPLNLLARANLPSVATLAQWGVRRLSAGSSLCAAAMAFVRKASTELLHQGTARAIFEEQIPYGELNALMAER